MIFISYGVSAQELQDPIDQISQSTYFKLLLHYKKNLWGQERSESSGSEFFLSPRGSFDPKAELLADIKNFQNPLAARIGPLQQHPQCAFPERFRFVKEQSHLIFVEIPCPEFQKWKQHFKPRSLTLVYAAPYLGSPSSIFGHSFLRIDSREQALLDYGISFEASTGPDPGLLYALKGLTGFYPGRFSQTPYFLKVNTYTSVESRALWEYQLNLTPEEIDRMLGHVWEMGTTYFDYYFFNKNCSYHLLSLIEVAHPEFHLRSQFGPMAIPVDTIRALTKYPDSMASVHFRPALSDLLMARLGALKPNDRDRFYFLIHHPEALDKMDGPELLDTLLDWQSLQAQHPYEQKFLLARSRFLSPSVTPQLPIPAQPEKGHKSSKISFGIGHESNQQTLAFEFRPAIHDLLDPDQAYIPYSELLIAQTNFSYLIEDQKLRLDRFQIAKITNFAPLTKLTQSPSWSLGAQLFRPSDLTCRTCLGAQISGGVGPSLTALEQHLLIYSLAKLTFEYANAYLDETLSPFRFGPSLELGVIAAATEKLKLSFSFEKPWYLAQPQTLSKINFGSSYSFENFQMRFTFEQFLRSDRADSQGLLSLGYFY